MAAHSPSLPHPTSRDRWLAVAIGVVGAAIGLGGAMEFRYFGPSDSQFWAGVAATPAGIVALAAAARLWQRGTGARRWVSAAAIALLVAVAVGATLDTMGPPPILLGLLGAAAALAWTLARGSR